MEKFTNKIAQEVAQHQFNWTIGCVVGTDDPDFSLSTDVDELEQNFEEILEDIGINPTPKRIENIKKRYEILVEKTIKKLNLMYKEVSF